MGKHSVYTPQLIVNGSRAVLGSSRQEALAAIAAVPPPATIRMSIAGESVQVELPEIEGGCDCDLLLLGVLPSSRTEIGRGENAGRVLREFNIVRQVYDLAVWSGKESLRIQPMPRLPADASLLVLLAQSRKSAQIVAVGTAPLGKSR
jgi:hypothetical protein